MRAEDLVAAVPGLATVAEIQATTLRTVPGASLTDTDLLESLPWAQNAVDSGAFGAVLVQGTDTLEESAYLLDLFWDRPQPLVLTGAMRPPQLAGADGPANLLAAVTAATSAAISDVGVVVVLNDEVMRHPGCARPTRALSTPSPRRARVRSVESSRARCWCPIPSATFGSHCWSPR